MENASKALIIAAGIFFGLLIITISLFMFNKISDYYELKEADRVTEQLTAFNKQYTSYNRSDVRGSDILSLINKIIDFNGNRQIGAEEMKISISIKDSAGKYKNFYYKYAGSSSETLLKTNVTYTHGNIGTSFLNKANSIASKYGGKADKLASNISTLIIDEGLTGTSKDRAEKARQDLLEQLKINGISDQQINNDILDYYQYQQFKRAHFDCTLITFTKSGRVESFEFEFNGKFE